MEARRLSGAWKTGAWASGAWAHGAWRGMCPDESHGAAEHANLVREHWDYINDLREQQQSRSVLVSVSDDVRGTYQISIPLDMPIPQAIDPRAMRGTVLRVSDVLGDPLILAALAILADEAD